jgi:hypothetical protein
MEAIEVCSSWPYLEKVWWVSTSQPTKHQSHFVVVPLSVESREREGGICLYLPAPVVPPIATSSMVKDIGGVSYAAREIPSLGWAIQIHGSEWDNRSYCKVKPYHLSSKAIRKPKWAP